MSDSVPVRTRQGKRRWLATVAIVLIAGVALFGWWAKGRGLWTGIVNWLSGEPLHPKPGHIIEGPPDPEIRFEKVQLPLTKAYPYTCVEIGPDHRLYAAVDDGRILRFAINSDGTLSLPQVITSLQQAQGGKRVLTGFCFDPASTADNLIIWASHGYYAFHDAPDFSGSITRLRGSNLETVEDAVIHLPRSIRDHMNNQPRFGPDGALYFGIGGNSASGAPDEGWGNRPERLLSASILRLETRRVTPGHPVDVLTRDAGGAYDPYAADAPLTIYASGLRNAYDLVWASDGNLYVPVNGSNAGGNAPAGAGNPGLTNIPEDEHDWFCRVERGKYYGHPNPQQNHFVLNGGNPDGREKVARVLQYPLGTRPDPDYQLPIIDFGLHCSPDGIIEYRGNAFSGKLDRKLLVCRFNLGSDVLAISVTSKGKVDRVESNMPGCTGFLNPLDLIEDPSNGNLYVAEYGGQCISLLRPIPSGQ